MVAFSGFYESHEPPPLGDVRGIVPPHRHGHQNDQQRGGAGGRRGDTERVLARWQSLVAFMKALDLFKWAMRSVSHRRTAMAIEMARDGGAFVRRRRLFRLL